MIERILEVLKAKNFSPSQFADEIGVQRSNISHLVSGRNKPSLEFIQKIIKRFPDINPDYLLSGLGNMLRDGAQTELSFVAPLTVQLEEPKPEQRIDQEIVEPVKIPKKKETDVGDLSGEMVEMEKKDETVEKIVYFYRDKTFKEYLPE